MRSDVSASASSRAAQDLITSRSAELHKRPFNNQLSLNSIGNLRAAASVHYWLSGHQLSSNFQRLFVRGCWDTFINTTAYTCYLRGFISSELPRAII